MQRLYAVFVKFWHATLNFLIVQWCLMLMSWPVMLAWGLPVPTLSPLGNAVFGPFLIVFLTLSSCIAVATACALPVWPVTTALDYTVKSWLFFLDLTPWDWNLVFVCPPLWLSLCAPLGTVLIMHYHPWRAKAHIRFTALFMFSVLVYALFALVPPAEKTSVPLGNHRINLVHRADGTIVAQDAGFVRRKSGMESWTTYTLLPSLAKAFGKQEIDLYELQKLTPGTIAFAKMLCEHNLIRALAIPQVPEKVEDETEELIACARASGVVLYQT